MRLWAQKCKLDSQNKPWLGFLIRLGCWFPIMGLLFLIGYVYVAYLVYFLWYSVEDWWLRVCLGLLGHVCLLLWLVSYLRAILTPVGRPSEKFRVPDELHEKLLTLNRVEVQDAAEWRREMEVLVGERGLTVEEMDGEGFHRYCYSCRVIKPDRCHHCSTCGHCVLKLDHHCPWINNCVNFNNYKFFVLTLVHTEILCLFAAASVSKWIVVEDFLTSMTANNGSNIHLIAIAFIGVIFACSAVPLLILHLRLTAKNQTTMESIILCSSKKFTNSNIPRNLNYNLGWKNNFQSVFGNGLLVGILPMVSNSGDGETFVHATSVSSDIVAV